MHMFADVTISLFLFFLYDNLLCCVAVAVVKGFSKDIRLPRAKFVGYIKNYEGATLMEVGVAKHH